MTHRILAPLKTFALSIGLRLAAGKSRLAETAVPEPIREYLNPNAVDEWMFDRDGSPVTEAATLYSRDFGRVSNTLSSLRALLTDIAAHAPVSAELPLQAAFGPITSDDVLFDGEPMAAHYGDVPAEDADLFMDVVSSSKSAGAEMSHVA
ncbi:MULTISPECIES: hypothetical protein [unclassified Hyphomonas]|jgi:hypothetical protein|uniref:Uncharacterized protein n=1 Tax=hydrothermal vent metagenome TaxID=652676 RepID=A0A160U0Z7_9ZZZZ|nr:MULTISPECIES: hypothetical protein [unclassified Hyphomonas]MAN91159.1 hypothetical protein [Hyphomonadaceae bacterium]MAA82847.1 hypothetical protein [Hyphomonas sp.]MBG67342.1 hypothetical protein [Hyphomonas sp.]MBO6582440.1 hypothetical protein [Hyphomonas sp.]MDF1806366.1 hypothetical protein [Hyphomonas sp.]|tara:strand:+ start:49 stop:498 length:450 start_codon:yes stop_codon:yes gene_type:complete